MKTAYHIFLFLALAYIFIIVTDGCEEQRRIEYGTPRPEDTYLSIREADDIIFAVVFSVLAIVFRILWDRQKAKKLEMKMNHVEEEVDETSSQKAYNEE